MYVTKPQPLQRKVREHGVYISANQKGLKIRTRLTIGGLAMSVVILVTVIAAFTKALVEKTVRIEEMEDMVKAIREDVDLKIMNPYNDLDKRIESLIESKIDHQIGYQ